MSPWLGVVADDLTGACDVAGGLTELGFVTTVLLGIPERPLDSTTGNGIDCIVIALRSRTAPVGQAVAESLAAARWLIASGAQRIYQKYCSTFDSTDRGNIGPVADALADLLGSGTSVGTPATPQLGRTQRGGRLFVNGVELGKSPMRRHPLTPMTESNVVTLLGRQSTRPVTLLGKKERFARGSVPHHVLVDAVDDSDLDALAADLESVERDVLIGGAGGLALALARRRGGGAPRPDRQRPAEGRRLILCGSGSARTREQISAFAGPILTFDPRSAINPEDRARQLASELARCYDHAEVSPVLVTSASDPTAIRAAQLSLGTAVAAELVERVLGELAVIAADELGVRRMLIAGGETSGAVTAALGVARLDIGNLAAPGVPWTIGTRPSGEAIALLLKSGNFGERNLFETAWESAP